MPSFLKIAEVPGSPEESRGDCGRSTGHRNPKRVYLSEMRAVSTLTYYWVRKCKIRTLDFGLRTTELKRDIDQDTVNCKGNRLKNPLTKVYATRSLLLILILRTLSADLLDFIQSATALSS